MKLDKHQVQLRKIAQALEGVGELYRHVLAFCVAECPKDGKDEEREAHIVSRFDAALTGLDAAYNTLRLYRAAAISIALRQNVVAKVAVPNKDGAIGKQATREVTLGKITNKRDFEKLAVAAREARKGVSHGASGKTKVTSATVAAAMPKQDFETAFRAMIKLQAGRASLITWAKAEGYVLMFSMADATLDVPTVAPVETKITPQRKGKSAQVAAHA